MSGLGYRSQGCKQMGRSTLEWTAVTSGSFRKLGVPFLRSL